MRYGAILKQAVQILDKYEPGKQCVDTFIDESAKNLENCPASEQRFITDIVYGCFENQKLLNIVVNVFYEQKGKFLLKADRNQFVVVLYITMFHLNDLGWEEFSVLIRTLDSSKMYKFLSFFLNPNNLTTWIHGEWSQIYDANYVEHRWITPLLSWKNETEDLLDQLERQTTKDFLPKKFPKRYTEPQEFHLTKPKPRPLPAPDLIPQQEKTKPVPVSTYKAPKEQKCLDDIKQKNHLKAQHVLYEANTQQFRCANPEKSEKTKNIVSQIQQNMDTKLKFDSVYSSGTPATYKINNLPIRLNTTAILREGALYNRQMEKEQNRLELLTQGASEPSAFLQWQKEMREKDLHEELAQLERRRLEGKISHEEALLARQRVLELNQHKALLKREEKAELMRKYAEKRLAEIKEMKELVHQVASGHKNSKAAKVRLQMIKKRIVKEVSEQSQEMLRQALENAQAELSRKFELIRQIRAIESAPRRGLRFVDDTETGGHQLLCEMSLAELRKRLAKLKEEQLQEQEKRRQKILEEKQSKEQLLLEQLGTITAHRTVSGFDTTLKQDEKETKLKLNKAVSMDDRVVALQRTLEMKQQERQKIKETQKTKEKINEHVTTQKFKSYTHIKQIMEEPNFLQLEQILEKEIQKETLRRNTP